MATTSLTTKAKDKDRYQVMVVFIVFDWQASQPNKLMVKWFLKKQKNNHINKLPIELKAMHSKAYSLLGSDSMV